MFLMTWLRLMTPQLVQLAGLCNFKHLRKFKVPSTVLKGFLKATVEFVLTGCLLLDLTAELLRSRKSKPNGAG